MVSASDSDQKPVEDVSVHFSAVEFDRIQVLYASFLIGKPLDELTETQCFLFRHIGHLPLMLLYMSLSPINVTIYYILCSA